MADGLPGDEIVRRIKKALEYAGNTHTWDNVRDLIEAKHAQIFWNEHGCWITEIIRSPLTQWLHVWIVAGELPDVMSLQPQVIDFAKANGCRRLTATARFGWKHVAKAHGWKRDAMVITHDIL